MHMFWSVNRKRIHNAIHADMNDTAFSPAYITVLWRFHNAWIVVRYSSLKDCCMTFWIVQLVAKGHVFRHPFASAWPPQMKNGSCILLGDVLPRSDLLSAGKWTKRFDWPTFLKRKSWLAVAPPQKNCQLLTHSPPPPPTCMHRHGNYYSIILEEGESRHPCQTPTVVQNQSCMLLLKRMALVALL